jgi:hypothetical protein
MIGLKKPGPVILFTAARFYMLIIFCKDYQEVFPLTNAIHYGLYLILSGFTEVT